jgi:hypothetical protein
VSPIHFSKRNKRPSAHQDSEESFYDYVPETVGFEDQVNPIFLANQKTGWQSEYLVTGQEKIYDQPDQSKLDVQHDSGEPINEWNIKEPEKSRPESTSTVTRQTLPVSHEYRDYRSKSGPVSFAASAGISEAPEPSDTESDPEPGAPLDFETQKRQIRNERWYFGAMDSGKAADLMNNAGDFLVRDSSRKKGQFVLTVRNANRVKHLNLLDEDGSIKNKTKSFKSVKEFIDYHTSTKDYIVSGEKYFLGQPAEERYDNFS